MGIFEIILVAVAALVIIGVGILVYFLTFYRKVEQGHALIVNTLRAEPEVTVTGRVVIPVLHKAEVMDISLKTIEIDRRGRDGLICKDNIRADIKVAFFVRVNKTKEDVLKVAQAIGCERASDQQTLEELFSAKFSEALKTVGKQLEFEDLYKERDSFRDKIIAVIGKDLNGYVLEDAAIDYLEQTPISNLDEDNILDAQGIRKITELTAEQHVRTNEARRDEEMRIKQKDVQAREAVLELERQEEDAIARQRREVESVRMREQAEIDSIKADEHLRSESVRIQAEEKIKVAEENKQREVEVANKNRERAVAIENERVERARSLEAIDREREVELQRIAKEKALEQERREISEVIRERIIVEKTVAEEEERIKELRKVAEAEREKRALVIAAEAEAERTLVETIKAAEAAEAAARHEAKERVVRAEASLDASEKEAQAKIRLAEGVQAESAAEGLAGARVTEANALAEEKVGMAKVRVQEAEAEAIEKRGRAEAAVEKEKLVAVASGERERGMADAQVKMTLADSIERQGAAEAAAIKERMLAEAGGLREKFSAMESMGEAGRAYEELRLKLEVLQAVQVARIDSEKSVAQSQADVLSEALRNADIDIVGGDGTFLERMVGAVSMGKSVDAIADSSRVGKLLDNLLDQENDLGSKLKQALADISSEDLKNLSLSAFLARLSASGQGDLHQLLNKALPNNNQR